MHFKNGREAHEGDPVVLKGYNGAVYVGVLVDTNPGSDTCNATVARAVGPPMTCVTVSQMWHAEDALANSEATLQPPAAAPADPPPQTEPDKYPSAPAAA